MQVSQSIGKDRGINSGISGVNKFCLLAILLPDLYYSLRAMQLEIQSITDLNQL